MHRDSRTSSRCISAEIHVPPGGAEVVVYALGANAGGSTHFVKDGVLNFAYIYEGHKTYRIVSETGLPEGDAIIHYGFEVTATATSRKG